MVDAGSGVVGAAGAAEGTGGVSESGAGASPGWGFGKPLKRFSGGSGSGDPALKHGVNGTAGAGAGFSGLKDRQCAIGDRQGAGGDEGDAEAGGTDGVGAAGAGAGDVRGESAEGVVMSSELCRPFRACSSVGV